MTNFLVLAGGQGTFSTAEPKPLRLRHGVRVRAAAVPVPHRNTSLFHPGSVDRFSARGVFHALTKRYNVFIMQAACVTVIAR